MVGSRAFRDAVLNEGFMILLKKLCRLLFLGSDRISKEVQFSDDGSRVIWDLKDIDIQFALIGFWVRALDIFDSIDVIEHDMIWLNTDDVS